jgi:hypothetical protein
VVHRGQVPRFLIQLHTSSPSVSLYGPLCSYLLESLCATHTAHNFECLYVCDSPHLLKTLVQTTPSHLSSAYGQRRAAIRETFLPALERLPNVHVQFVVGKSSDPRVDVAMAVEEEIHPGTFMHLNVTVRGLLSSLASSLRTVRMGESIWHTHGRHGYHSTDASPTKLHDHSKM